MLFQGRNIFSGRNRSKMDQAKFISGLVAIALGLFFSIGSGYFSRKAVEFWRKMDVKIFGSLYLILGVIFILFGILLVYFSTS